jgi:N-acetylmuramoyl-L-alanine amidase
VAHCPHIRQVLRCVRAVGADQRRPFRPGRPVADVSAASLLIVVLAGCAGNGSSSSAVSPHHRSATGSARTIAVNGRPGTTNSRGTTVRVRVSHPSHRRKRPLEGRIVGVDPGHNGGNFNDPTYIERQIWNGREYEDCNTTGTETDAGYTEALFNWRVSSLLVRDLRLEGAKVVMTRRNNSGVGPCVSTRAAVMNRAHVNVVIAIHADGGPPNGRGFAILEPVPDGINDASISASYRFARILRSAFLAGTGMPISTYGGVDGLQPRDDLAGENLTREAYVLIECGNMRNAQDASMLINPPFQRRAAKAMAVAITRFLLRSRRASGPLHRVESG